MPLDACDPLGHSFEDALLPSVELRVVGNRASILHRDGVPHLVVHVDNFFEQLRLETEDYGGV